VGLRNTRERLAVLYGENHRFSVANCHPGLRVDMGLPLETAEPAADGARARPTFPASVARGVNA
jgi:hypothetical protein